MTVRPIRLVPDPVLRTTCTPVTDFDDDLRKLTDDMLATMYAAPGRGLAAPQIGVTRRVFVIDATWKDGPPSPGIFINPEITARSDEMATMDEGCLSIPDQLVAVTRPGTVTLRWQGRDGELQEGRFTGFAAACVQHEMDHLDGVLCTDYEAAR